MAIRFDKQLNKEIRREVDKINKKFARARQMGYSKVPANLKVSEIKKQFASKYATRTELRRQLAQYNKTNLQDLSKVVELYSGSRVSLQKLKLTEQRRLRLYRKVRRDIREAEARQLASSLPFNRDEIARLKNVERLLSEGSRVSESRMRMINEMYTREYSSTKKDAFERSLLDTFNDQLDRVKLSDDPAQDQMMKRDFKRKMESIDVDSLIKMNRQEDDFAEILDRYKGKDEYVNEDIEPLQEAYRSIYKNIDEYIKIYEG